MMIPQTFESGSARATEQFAARLAPRLKPGDVLGLVGDLGAGKTCFVRGLARALGVPTDVPVTSPTFTMMNEYTGRLAIYHFDWYRVSDVEELEAIGYRDFVGGDGIAVIEWADRVPGALPASYIRVDIELDPDPNRRLISVEQVSPIPRS